MPERRNSNSRSFTLSRPPPSKLREAVQRTKTYTGCWTCRARKSKCDEQKPACLRCIEKGLGCEGYQVRLVWEADVEGGKQIAQRRTYLTGREAEGPVLSSSELHSALEHVEATPFPRTVQAGLFSVFPAIDPETTSTDISSTPQSNAIEIFDCDEPLLLNFEEEEGALQQLHLSGDGGTSSYASENAINHSSQESEAAMAMLSIKQMVLPQVESYLASASPEERFLLHYWVTVLSGMMIPTQCLDNPFRTIFIPLALTASHSPEDFPGSASLLHAIYALSAFNRAGLTSSREYFEELGIKHHRTSLRYLRRSLTQIEALSSQQEAILAAIITMSSIEIMKGNSATWRTHLAGGKTWLRSLMEKGCAQSANFSLLCQIFFCLDALGSPDVVGQVATPFEEFDSPISLFQVSPWGAEYSLDKLFGVSEPILKAIIRINAWSGLVSSATEEEMDDLENLIRRNDPDVLIQEIDANYDDMTRHHACAFFCATLIYFQRRIRKTPPSKLQRLVQRSFDHLDAVRTLESEMGVQVCGLFWPEFITTCEAESAKALRTRSLTLLEKGTLRGIGNIVSAREVVLELWQQRDNGVGDYDFTWYEVMADMGLDLPLA